MDMTLHISRSLADEILTLALRSGTEICGLLLGDGDAVYAIRPCRNVHPTPATHFELDPAALFDTLRAGRRGGPHIIGHYHSHPSGLTGPSRTDAAAAAPDGAVWIIAAGGDLTGWRAVHDGAVHGRFDPLTLAIAP